MINHRLVNISLITFGVIALVLIIFPMLDIDISNLFYEKNVGFKYRKQAILMFFFEAVPTFTKIFALICVSYLIYLFAKFKSFKKIISSWAFFLVISAVLGPGVGVNMILKENFGRARPREIIEFGGNKIFSGAPLISDQCHKNCSFPSGHAAMGYYFTSIAYTYRQKYFTRIYLTTMLFGSIVALSRVMMGGHFASDVIISAFLILLLNHLIYKLWKKRLSILKI